MPSRKVDKKVTPTYLLMQRLADNDPTGHLLNKKKDKIYHVCLPAELYNDKTKSRFDVKPEKYRAFYEDGLLDSLRLDREVLTEALIDLGSAAYTSQYGQAPAPKGGLIWRRWFIPIDDVNFPKKEAFNQYGTDWDLAYTKNDLNAASAYITAGKINGKMFIDDLGRIYAEFPELIKFMKERERPHYIEAKASGQSAKQTLVKNGIPAIEVKVVGGDKIARAQMAAPYPESGLCFFRKSLIDRLYIDPEQGILNFPNNKKQDLADVLAQAIQRIFKGGLITASASRPSVLDAIKPR